MASMTKIYILITAIITISGKELNLSKDTVESNITVPNVDKMKDFLKSMKICNGIYGFFGCVTTNRSIIFPRIREYYDMIQPKTDSDNIKSTEISKTGIFWWLRQRLLDTSPFTSSSSTSETNNRNRRSAPSSTKYPVRRPPDRLVKDRKKISERSRIMYLLLATIAAPYIVIVPNKNYEEVQNGPVYYS